MKKLIVLNLENHFNYFSISVLHHCQSSATWSLSSSIDKYYFLLTFIFLFCSLTEEKDSPLFLLHCNAIWFLFSFLMWYISELYLWPSREQEVIRMVFKYKDCIMINPQQPEFCTLQPQNYNSFTHSLFDSTLINPSILYHLETMLWMLFSSYDIFHWIKFIY